jgi:LuxR family maltose regulon positive regulatory protein
LEDASAAPVVLVEAPAGFGKTTAVAQWVTSGSRPVAWLTVADDDRDRDALTTDLIRAFHAVPQFGNVLGATRDSAPTERLARLTSIVKHASTPFVLVIDEVEWLGTSAQAVLRGIARVVPRGSQLVLLTRGVHELSLAAWAGPRDVVVFRTDDLAMSVDEAEELFGGAGLSLARSEVEALVRTTQGWPAALVLAASSLAGDPDPADAASTFSATDPLVEDYLETEVLSKLSRRDRELLTSCSVLRRLSGPACDAVLATQGATRRLAQISRDVGPLLRSTTGSASYELPRLVRDLLRTQLLRGDAAHARELMLRAAEWYESQRDVGEAITLAHAARDRDRVVRLTWEAAPVHAATGPIEFGRWMERWSDEEIVDDPVLCVSAAWGAFARGDLAAAGRWSTFARRGREDLVLPGGTPLRSALALLRGMLGRAGLTRMVDDAGLAAELGAPDDLALAIARYVRGSAYRLLGDAGRARAQLEAAAAQASTFDAGIEAHCFAQLALLAVDQGGWHEARTLASSARRRILDAEPGSPPQIGASAALAYFQSLESTAEIAGDALDRVRCALVRMDGAMPWLAIDARLLVADGAVQSNDFPTARTVAHEAGQLLADYPDAGELGTRFESLRQTIWARRLPLGVAASGLTPAESRVLQYLPTHLTFPEIADALFVSRHTVKTQAVAVYRKLSVSSRNAAVAAARELGLLDD